MRSADIHGSKSVGITPRLYAIFYPLPTHFHFLLKIKIYRIPLAEYFIREAYFTFSQKRKYFTFGEAEYVTYDLRNQADRRSHCLRLL